MLLFTIIILIILLVYLLQNNISVLSLFNVNLNEQFLIAVKDRQKIGTTDNEDGNQPKSTMKNGGRNYESCYSTETRNGNSTGRKGTYFCKQGVDGGEAIPGQGLYALDMSNYNIHPGKAIRGKPLRGTYSNTQGKAYTLNSDGVVTNETLTLAQSKSLCDALKDKCAGFIMIMPVEGVYSAKTIFISKIDEGWEDPDNYSKKVKLNEISTNTISYVKKDANFIEKKVSQDKINTIADKYINLSTCNWKSANRCIFRDYKYDQSNGSCRTKDGLTYSVDALKDYNEQGISEWLKTLYNRDMGINKLESEAVNVNEYVQRCKDVDGYEFLSGVDAPNPYNPTKQGDVKGRYVRISLNNRDVSQNWLQLAEVQIISNNRNIALSKPTSSSGNYPGSSNAKANDGNNDGNWSNSSVFIGGNGTYNNDGGPQYWEVDLGDASQTIDRIIVTNRTDCCGGRLNNWLLTIYDNSKNAIWANVYKDHPNPKVSIDILQSNNKLSNIKLDDYKQSEFNNKFYRVSPTEFTSKQGYQSNCNEDCHKNACEGEKKKWLSNYQCRDYKPGELEAELAEKKRLQEQNKFIPIPNNTPHMVAYRGQLGKIFSIYITGNTNGNAVWGTDNYTDDSDIRRAAVHAGIIANGESKTVYIEMLPGQSSYSSTNKNSINTSPYGNWGGTYRFVKPVISDKPTLFLIQNSGIPNFNLGAFPKLGLMDNWEMIIDFLPNGGQNTWRAMIGDMYNNFNNRGWGVWVSSNNSIHWSWARTTWEPNFQVILGNRYTLKIINTPNEIKLILFNQNNNTTQSASKSTNNDKNTYSMTTNGPVTIGGWISYGGERFPGTIYSIEVR